MPLALGVLVLAIAALAYSQYSTSAALDQKFAALQDKLQQDATQNMKKLQASINDQASDLDVLRKHMGVTAQELADTRKSAEKLRQEQERAKQELAKEIATKANTTDVARDVSAARDEASNKVAAVAKDADTKIGGVSGKVDTVNSDLQTTKGDLAASRREIVDVRTTLSQQIAHNSSELADLRRKGERDFFEFDIKKAKKGQMSRVADIQLELRDTDPKKQRYAVLIQVDDNKLEKKDRTANEPVQFLVGRDKLRYELVVNLIDKDRIRGYLSAPKDKALSAERPQARN
jgi:chromosome segregation ATPase